MMDLKSCLLRLRSYQVGPLERNKYPHGHPKHSCVDYVWPIYEVKDAIHKLAVEWIKEDIEQMSVSIKRWMERLNVSEDDLKGESDCG